jgi:3-hydroxypropionyl-CoA synthetase (ADP-forming)
MKNNGVTDSRQLLEEYGFIRPRRATAQTPGEAGQVAREIGFPVALKVASADIIHKVDVGGVQLNLFNEQQVKAAYRQIMQNVKDRAAHAAVSGVEVEEMCTGGVEIFIGLINDAQFGPSITFGLGGIFVEVLDDVSYRVLPIQRSDAEAMIAEIKGQKILNGYRGLPAVSHPMLVDLIMRAAKLGMDLSPHLDSVDLNPIMVWENDYRVLDAKILLRDQKNISLETQPNTRHLDKFFHAGSVALVGASGTPGKIGNSVMDSLTCHEYRGEVYPINPERVEVMGLKAYPSIASLPKPVDLVVVTVALKLVPEILTQCAQQDIHNVVIISGGGKELGVQSQELEATIARMAKELDIRIVGPNCIGIFDGKSRLDTFFQVWDRLLRPPAGPIALVTQSGTVGGAFLEMASLGISKQVSFGNRVDVDESDLIAYLADDDETKVITCYVEGLANGRKFLETVRQVAKRKPVLIQKGGRSERGARASISHTGFFGGRYGLFCGAMKQAHGILLDSIEELYAAASAVVMQPLARGRKVALISSGAGTMVQALDLLPEYGLELASLSVETIEGLKKVYPPFYIVQNPLDVTGSATCEDYRRGIEALLKDPKVDIVMPYFVFQNTPLEETIVSALFDLSKATDKPIICAAMGGPYARKMSSAIEAVSIPVYGTVREWVAAAKGVAYGATD